MTTTLVHQLLEAGVHFGHQTKRWHPKMKQFIFGSRAGIYIIDLEKTEQLLMTACDFLEEVTANGERVLFVGTKKQAKGLLQAEATRVEMPYVVSRWLGGTLTNFETVRRSISQLVDLRQQKADGVLDRVSKKEAKQLNRKLERLEEHCAGLTSMDRLPGCLFVVDTKREQIAVREANRLSIPVVAICDTNADPDLITHPVPGNDDAIRSIALIVGKVTERVLIGRQRYLVQHPPAPAAPAEGTTPAAPAVGTPSEGDTAEKADKPVEQAPTDAS